MEVDNNITAIILAAGKSERLGEPKALIKCGNNILIDFIVKRLESINLKVIIVTNSELKNPIKKALKSKTATIIVPDDVRYRTGNLIAGLSLIENPNKILVVPIDRPGWSLKTINILLKMNQTCCPEFKGKGGHPLLICKNDINKLKNSKKDYPLNLIFNTKKIKVDDSNLHLNIDTPDDIEILKNYIKNIQS